MTYFSVSRFNFRTNIITINELLTCFRHFQHFDMAQQLKLKTNANKSTQTGEKNPFNKEIPFPVLFVALFFDEKEKKWFPTIIIIYSQCLIIFFFFGISIFQLFLHSKIGKQSRKKWLNKKCCDIKSDAEKERCQKMTFE